MSPKKERDNVVRSKKLPPARMNSTVRLLAWSILFVGLSGFILLFFITGALNGWWGDSLIPYSEI